MGSQADDNDEVGAKERNLNSRHISPTSPLDEDRAGFASSQGNDRLDTPSEILNEHHLGSFLDPQSLSKENTVQDVHSQQSGSQHTDGSRTPPPNLPKEVLLSGDYGWSQRDLLNSDRLTERLHEDPELRKAIGRSKPGLQSQYTGPFRTPGSEPYTPPHRRGRQHRHDSNNKTTSAVAGSQFAIPQDLKDLWLRHLALSRNRDESGC